MENDNELIKGAKRRLSKREVRLNWLLNHREGVVDAYRTSRDDFGFEEAENAFPNPPYDIFEPKQKKPVYNSMPVRRDPNEPVLVINGEDSYYEEPGPRLGPEPGGPSMLPLR